VRGEWLSPSLQLRLSQSLQPRLSQSLHQRLSQSLQQRLSQSLQQRLSRSLQQRRAVPRSGGPALALLCGTVRFAVSARGRAQPAPVAARQLLARRVRPVGVFLEGAELGIKPEEPVPLEVEVNRKRWR
jgi:hypothetical protein